MAAAALARRQLFAASGIASRAAIVAATNTTSSSTTTTSTSTMITRRGYATPMGPPPKGFRTSRPVEWAGDKDSTLDKMGKYFLMLEMARGMYILLEQFFRPPYVVLP
jgi:NADH dehydrogenase (ubiquinone) Fe-S protein 8